MAPAAFVLVFEGLAWAITGITDADGPAVVAGYILIAGVVAAVLVPIGILLTRQKDAWMWAVISICLSSLGLFFGFILYLGAITANCGGGCFA